MNPHFNSKGMGRKYFKDFFVFRYPEVSVHREIGRLCSYQFPLGELLCPALQSLHNWVASFSREAAWRKDHVTLLIPSIKVTSGSSKWKTDLINVVNIIPDRKALKEFLPLELKFSKLFHKTINIYMQRWILRWVSFFKKPLTIYLLDKHIVHCPAAFSAIYLRKMFSFLLMKLRLHVYIKNRPGLISRNIDDKAHESQHRKPWVTMTSGLAPFIYVANWVWYTTCFPAELRMRGLTFWNFA